MSPTTSRHSATEQLVSAAPGDRPQLALVLKRTYDLAADGQCRLSELQLPLAWDWRSYDPEIEAPLASPPEFECDMLAFKRMTDVVVQGSAYCYGPPLARTQAELRFGTVHRVIRVFGDRTLEQTPEGKPRFSDPAPFQSMPLRYDRAYGGLDLAALEDQGDFLGQVFEPVEPAWGLSHFTPFHYPRNPAGRGYCLRVDRTTVGRVQVPNLDFPFDPVTPERLAVGDPLTWLPAPLPAGMDWCDPAWFPRSAYAGLAGTEDVPQGHPKEIELGWAPADILLKPSIIQGSLDDGFLQGASPGLWGQPIAPGEVFVLENMHPKRSKLRVELPADVPRISLHISPTRRQPLEPRLNAVVIRPDPGQVILVWSCTCAVDRRYPDPQLEEMSWDE